MSDPYSVGLNDFVARIEKRLAVTRWLLIIALDELRIYEADGLRIGDNFFEIDSLISRIKEQDYTALDSAYEAAGKMNDFAWIKTSVLEGWIDALEAYGKYEGAKAGRLPELADFHFAVQEMKAALQDARRSTR